MNMCKEMLNSRRPLRICAKWCTTFGGFCEYVPSGAYMQCPLCVMFCLLQCMMNVGSQLHSIANLGFQN